MEFKAIKAEIEVKEAGQDDGVLKIRAYALAFGNLDSAGDIILPGACDKWLASEMASRLALCYQHDFHNVIGKITDKGVDERGLWIEADILPTSIGKDVQILLRSGAIKEFSIGYRADEYHYAKTDEYEYEIRYLDAITLYEVSPVTLAANPRAELQRLGKNAQTNDIDLKVMSDQEIEKLRADVEREYASRIILHINN